MRIRLAYIAEMDLLHGIVNDATRLMNEQGILQWDEIYPNKAILTRDIERQDLYVIEAEGRVAGFIVIDEDLPPEYATVEWRHSGRSLVVHRLTIAPAYQRLGLATRLMNFAEETAAIQGYNCIRLDAFMRNPAALALYEKRGYKKTGVVRFRKGDFCCYEKSINAESTT